MATSMHTAPIDVRKFQFDEFDGEEGGLAMAALPPAVYNQDELDTAIHAAQEEAYERGKADAEASIEGDLHRLMTRIATAADDAITDQRALQETIGGESVRLAALIARKVLPAMAETGALTEIEVLIQRCLSERPEESRLVVRLHDIMLDKIEGRLAKIIADTGFAGKPILLADPAMQKNEVRIEWANGGVDWSFARQMADVDAACNSLGARPKVKTYDTPTQDTRHDDSQMSEIMDAEIIEPAPTTEDESE